MKRGKLYALLSVLLVGLLWSVAQTETVRTFLTTDSAALGQTADIAIKSYTKAQLDALGAGTAGRLARVTDDVRGPAVDLGDQWWLQNRTYGIPVEWFGAKRDGTTDDRVAIQAALDVAGATNTRGLKILFRRARYVSSGNLTLPANSHGITLEGVGSPTDAGTDRGSWIDFTAGGFVTSISSGVTFENLNINLGASAGPGIDINNLSNSYFKSFVIISANPAQPLIKGRTSLIFLKFSNFILNPAAAHSQPAMDLRTSGGASLNNVTVEDAIFNGRTNATAPLARFESELGVGTKNVFRDLLFEIPGAGALHLFSIQRSRIEGLWAGDLATLTAPIIRIAKGLGDVSASILIYGVEMDIGTAANPSLLIETNVPGQGNFTIISSRLPVISNNGPGGIPLVVIDDDNPTFVGDAPLRIGAGAGDRIHNASFRQTKGISSTTTAAANLAGTFTISGTDTSATVTFATAEADTNYRLAVRR